jgi:DNA-binding MarR family transcriptional regulator
MAKPTVSRAKAVPSSVASIDDRPIRSVARVDEPSLGMLDGFIGFHLRLAQDASFRSFAKRAGRRDLKPGRFAAMMVIHDNPGINQTALGRAIARDKSTISPLLQDLERQGLILRRSPANDGRSFVLSLTAKGESTIEELLVRAREHDRKLDEIVGDRKGDFIRLLKRIAQSLA